ncbi:hypothetical protein [Pseudooceanicola marinus]|uniref:hypothetical protein n=1 Tax=Pseudooceanicola marinus TaxID=396013 RepID=UPI001CD7B767|nr:hypothetical protein [Pseudooceanicola marinus]MCA1337194.1 hypothetical protein [Pseudooceanicola marinus]
MFQNERFGRGRHLVGGRNPLSRSTPFALIALLILLGPTRLQAEPIGGALILEDGASAQILSAPPTGLFNLPGKSVATAEPGTAFVITGDVQTQKFFGTTQWVEVAPLGEEQSTGWIDLNRLSAGDYRILRPEEVARGDLSAEMTDTLIGGLSGGSSN